VPPAFRIVPYERARHGDGPWRVVKSVFAEYRFPFEEHGYDADLLRPDDHYDGRTGWFAVAEDDAGRVIGTVGVSDEGAGSFELHRLYVHSEGRRAGVGGALVAWAIATAAAHGATVMELYSDIAFEDAHRLYRRHGFRNHRFRYAPDPWASREWASSARWPERPSRARSAPRPYDGGAGEQPATHSPGARHATPPLPLVHRPALPGGRRAQMAGRGARAADGATLPQAPFAAEGSRPEGPRNQRLVV